MWSWAVLKSLSVIKSINNYKNLKSVFKFKNMQLFKEQFYSDISWENLTKNIFL